MWNQLILASQNLHIGFDFQQLVVILRGCKSGQKSCSVVILSSSSGDPPPHSAYFACLSYLTPNSDNQLVRRELHEWTVLIDRVPTQCSLLPSPWAWEIFWSLLHFRTFIHGFALRHGLQRLHTQTKLTREAWLNYTSVNKYDLNSHLAHFKCPLNGTYTLPSN